MNPSKSVYSVLDGFFIDIKLLCSIIINGHEQFVSKGSFKIFIEGQIVNKNFFLALLVTFFMSSSLQCNRPLQSAAEWVAETARQAAYNEELKEAAKKAAADAARKAAEILRDNQETVKDVAKFAISMFGRIIISLPY